MKVTPQTLFELYRPACERIGWPKLDDGREMAIHPGYPETLAWVDEPGCGQLPPRSLFLREAAALLRCHAEDWLIRVAGEIIVADHTPSGGVARVTLGDTRLKCSRMFAGETLHHALVAAVLAALEAR